MFTLAVVGAIVMLAGVVALVLVVVRARSRGGAPRGVSIALCVALVLAGGGGVALHASEITTARTCLHCYAGLPSAH